MNKQYIVNDKGQVIAINDAKATVEKGIYTKNTAEILSLENYAESIEDKLKLFEKQFHKSNSTIRHKTKIARIINIFLTTTLILLSVLSATVSSKLFFLTILSTIPLNIAINLLEKIFTKKDKEKKEYYLKRVSEEKFILKKIKTKISKLSNDKTLDKNITLNTFIEIKPLENYNLDPEDYFIEKYQIDKRTKEMLGQKNKTKKLTRKPNVNNLYKI